MPVVIEKINGGSGTVMRDLIYFVVASNNGTSYGWRLILRVWSIFVSINGSSCGRPAHMEPYDLHRTSCCGIEQKRRCHGYTPSFKVNRINRENLLSEKMPCQPIIYVLKLSKWYMNH